MKLDAYIGGLDAIYYPSFQMALQGSKVLAVTDCLNFGNPQKPHIMSEFVASVDAITYASQKLDAPVISGNVSFYNESTTEVGGQQTVHNIISTPATGLVGIRESVLDLWSNSFTEAGHAVIQVQYQWGILNLQENKYVLNEACLPEVFVEKIQALQIELKKIPELFKSVSSIRSLALGGLDLTLQKMKSEKIDYQKKTI